jgi:hypothetical protein
MIMEVWMNIPYRELLKFISLNEALLLLVPRTFLADSASPFIDQSLDDQNFLC